MTKPIKIGNGAGLFITSDAPTKFITLDNTLNTPLLQGIDAADEFQILSLENIAFDGQDTQTMFDVKSNITGLFLFFRARILNMADIGTIENGFQSIQSGEFTDFARGVKFIKPAGLNVINMSFNTDVAGATSISIITDQAITGNFLLDETETLPAGSFTFFLDPATLLTNLYSISSVTSPTDQLFQPGTDIAVTGASDPGGGLVRFTTSVAHGLTVGRAVVNSTFSDSAYNGTFIVEAVDTPLTGVTYDVVATFTATGTGNMNAASLDQTDIRVNSNQNRNAPDSMFFGESGLTVFGSEITSSSLAQNVFEVVTSGSWAYGDRERTSIGVATQGQLIIDDPKARTYRISYSGTLEKSGGGAVDIGIILLKNGAISSFEPPHTVNTGKIQIGGNDIIELIKDDTIDIAIINYAAAATAIDISQLQLVLNKA